MYLQFHFPTTPSKGKEYRAPRVKSLPRGFLLNFISVLAVPYLPTEEAAVLFIQ